MKRRALAAIWVMGSTVPLLLAAVLVFGCCVLPFHAMAHKLMPVCDMAAALMRGDPGAHPEHDATPGPAREKQEPVRRIATEVSPLFRLVATTIPSRNTAPDASTTYRSFITLGALRCDRDVGLHVLVGAFLI